ncbi:putative zinc finger and SCAN domain-containing protein 20-like [Triplophysa rosa]|uniref:Zinc finger and SCAN domain-containing protein 20-like n=1 Tax=Triplophysa rosa TaxID=992332 RepID=A0A9W7TNI7_TRIRA|nr:putative zinc finger and SCAN domain-containing protein 20-like [Triplophysa rosa]
MEGIQGGPVTDSVPATETVRFIQVSGNRLTLLEPPEDVPGECTYAAAECTSADEETVSLDSRRLEDPDAAQSPKQPGNITSQTVRTLYAKHLERQIELADIKITLKKRKLQEMELDLEIKRRTLRKLDLEIQKLQREDPSNPDK